MESSFKDRRLHKIDLVEEIFEVLDSENSIMWPSFYNVRNGNLGEVRIECYDPVYMNQATAGDHIQIRGNLYAERSGEKAELRIIMGPWITTTQFVRKVNI